MRKEEERIVNAGFENFKGNLVSAIERLKNCTSFCQVALTEDNKLFYNVSLDGANHNEIISMIRQLDYLSEYCWTTIEERNKGVKE